MRTITKFCFLGKTPIQIIEDDEGVSLVAFNPFQGGYTNDPKYYRLVNRNWDNDVQEIDILTYQSRIVEICEEYGFPAERIETEKNKLASLSLRASKIKGEDSLGTRECTK